MLVREFTAEDYREIALICKNDLGYDCTEKLVLDKISKLDLRRERIYVAEENGDVVGFIHVEKYDILYMKTLVNVLGLAVKENYRRMGAGKMLLNAAEVWASDIGAVGVRLSSAMKRSGAHDFYRSQGYDNEKEQIRFMKKII